MNQSKENNQLYKHALGLSLFFFGCLAWPSLPVNGKIQTARTLFEFKSNPTPTSPLTYPTLLLHNHGGRPGVFVVVFQMRLQEKGKQPQEEGGRCPRTHAAGPCTTRVLPW